MYIPKIVLDIPPFFTQTPVFDLAQDIYIYQQMTPVSLRQKFACHSAPADADDVVVNIAVNWSAYRDFAWTAE